VGALTVNNKQAELAEKIPLISDKSVVIGNHKSIIK
jgi:hypothetical protein